MAQDLVNFREFRVANNKMQKNDTKYSDTYLTDQNLESASADAQLLNSVIAVQGIRHEA